MALEAITTVDSSLKSAMHFNPVYKLPTSSPPSSTSAAPKYSSGNIESLLCDSEGVEMFNQFLVSKYSLGHLLDFWFACKGFRTNVDPNNPDKMFQIAKVIYRTYIKSGATNMIPLPASLKHNIIDRMSSYHKGYKTTANSDSPGIHRTLFDLAQESVKLVLESTYFPEFLEFLGTISTSNNCDNVTNKLSFGNRPLLYKCLVGSPKHRCKGRKKTRSRNASQHSDENRHSTFHNHNQYEPPFPPEPFSPQSSSRLATHSLEENPASLRSITSWTATSNIESSLPRCIVPQSCGVDGSSSIRGAHCEPNCMPQCCSPRISNRYRFRDDWLDSSSPCHSCHIQLENPNPRCTVSHSVLTDDSHPSTGVDVPVVTLAPSRLPTDSPQPPVHSHPPDGQTPTRISIRELPVRKKDEYSVKQGQNLAETDPASFALLLTSRLEKVRESREKMEKLLSWVHHVDERNVTHLQLDVLPPDLEEERAKGSSSQNRDAGIYVSVESNPKSNVPTDLAESSVPVQPSISSVLLPLSSSFRTMFRSTAQNIIEQNGNSKQCDSFTSIVGSTATAAVTDEDAQGILDDHCSRIWADEQEPTRVVNHGDCFRPHDNFADVMVKSCIPATCVYPTTRRSRYPASWKASVRRRTAVSAIASHYTHAAPQPSRAPTQHRRSSVRANSSHNPRIHQSDVRSTASWDSGVIDGYPVAELNCRSIPGQCDLETRSNVDAASLQALSSSTTELAIANSEVTAKLVEYMTRHYQHPQQYQQYCQQHPRLTSHKSQLPSDPFTMSKKRSPYQDYDLFHHNHCRTANNSSMPPFTENSIADCSGPDTRASYLRYSNECPSSVWPRCPRPYKFSEDRVGPIWIPHSDLTQVKQYPITSDNSSAFDSGISSTYDQLPLGLPQTADRGSGNHVRLWHMDKAPHISHSHPLPDHLRVPSAPGPNYHVFVPSCQPSMHRGMACSPNELCPCCSLRLRHDSSELAAPLTSSVLLDRKPVSSRSAGGGQLLQHWLHLQGSCSEFHSTSKSNSGGRTKHSHRRSSALHDCSVAKHSVNHDRDPSGKGRENEDQTKLRSPDCSEAVVPSGQLGVIVGYYLCDDPVPYRTVWHVNNSSNNGPNSANPGPLTLGQFKQLIAKKGDYRYFFKKTSNEFGTGAVHEELTEDCAILPLWDGKVVARIERAD
ncbi:hypothetical protein EG68_03321 [Paragonimus skrjabini miyazakii]|uniref:Axis inhibition protein axin n=1 Tax=Paragonimus skrjabini miyazakii TaxID=59628 RepID=A0A8S9Z5K9_9TREM|nr:hypothetical protein EG68_03321 [Paragonimus skrjabini miyazakii]